MQILVIGIGSIVEGREKTLKGYKVHTGTVTNFAYTRGRLVHLGITTEDGPVLILVDKYLVLTKQEPKAAIPRFL